MYQKIPYPVKEKNIFFKLTCILCVFILAFPFFFIIQQSGHHCTGKDCHICIQIQQARYILQHLCLKQSQVSNFTPKIHQTGAIIYIFCAFSIYFSLVAQKIKLND